MPGAAAGADPPAALRQMIGFVAAVGATFKGDVLVQLSKAPMGVLLVVLLIATATLVPEIDAEAGYIPGNVRGAVEKLMAATKADAFFTETAELVNGRAAVRAPRVRCRVACPAVCSRCVAQPLLPDDGHACVPHHRLRVLISRCCCCCGQRCKLRRWPGSWTSLLPCCCLVQRSGALLAGEVRAFAALRRARATRQLMTGGTMLRLCGACWSELAHTRPGAAARGERPRRAAQRPRLKLPFLLRSSSRSTSGARAPPGPPRRRRRRHGAAAQDHARRVLRRVQSVCYYGLPAADVVGAWLPACLALSSAHAWL